MSEHSWSVFGGQTSVAEGCVETGRDRRVHHEKYESMNRETAKMALLSNCLAL